MDHNDSGTETMTPDEFRTARKALGYTQQSLADLLGVDARSVRRWEAGERELNPTACRVLIWLRDGKLRLETEATGLYSPGTVR